MAKRKRLFKYTLKQIRAYAKRSKDPKKKKKWQANEKRLMTAIKRGLKGEGKDKRRTNKIREFSKKQLAREELERLSGGERKEEIRGISGSQRTIGRKEKEFREQVRKTRPIIEYLKKETITRITKEYGQIIENERAIYGELFKKAMKNPEQFKELLIEKMEAIKSNLEIEMELVVAEKGKIKDYAKVTTNGKTIRELVEILNGVGVRPNETIDSIKLQILKEKTGSRKVAQLMKDSHKLINIRFNILLIRGKL